MRENIQNILACPVCGETKIRLTKYKCDSCGSSFFELNGIPCFFPSGGNQLQLWNHLLATFIEEGEATRNELEAEINKRTISSLTKQRLKATLHIHNESHTHLVKILRQAGLQPHINPSYQHYSTKVFSKYHELALRDWAWFDRQETNFSYGDRLHDENQIALNTILKVMKSTEQKKRRISSRILVIGAGAGRLSWDLHCALQPSMTIALDFNPLLSYVSKSLVRDKKNLNGMKKLISRTINFHPYINGNWNAWR